MRQENVEAIKLLIKHYGPASQYSLAMEECAELSVICSKLLRGDVPREKVVDAIADVYTMIQVLVIIGNVEPSELEDVAFVKLQNALYDAGLTRQQQEMQEVKLDEALAEDEAFHKGGAK